MKLFTRPSKKDLAYFVIFAIIVFAVFFPDVSARIGSVGGSMALLIGVALGVVLLKIYNKIRKILDEWIRAQFRRWLHME